MKKENFESLKESIIEASRVIRGEIPPARETIFEVEKSQINKKPVKAWAICVETDDEELLVPFKLYEVEVFSRGFRVIDEEGEATFCPEEFFMPITLPQEVTRKLTNLVQAA